MKKYFKQNRKQIIGLWALYLIALILGIKMQFCKGFLIDEAFLFDLKKVKENAIDICSIVVFQSIFMFLYEKYKIDVCQGIVKDIREDFFESLLSLDYPSFFSHTKGDILAQYTNHIDKIHRTYVTPLFLFLQMAGQILLYSIIIYRIHPILMLVALISFSVPILAPKYYEKPVEDQSKIFADEVTNNLDIFANLLMGFEVIKNYSVEKNIFKIFSQSNHELADSQIFYEKTFSKSVGISFFISLMAEIMVYAYAGYLLFAQKLSPGKFVTIISLIANLRIPLYWVGRVYQQIVSSRPLREKFCSFIQEAEQTKEKNNLPLINYDMTFHDLSFQYEPGRPVLKGIELMIREGEKILIHGKSGSGKSTFVKIMAGYDSPSHGFAKIGQEEIVRIHDLSNILTIVHQEAYIFNDTLYNNLSLGRPIDQFEILKMLNRLGFDQWSKKEDLYQMIDENGRNLSGGEKKRISLLRGIMKNTPILIFDEPTGNLDKKTASEIEDLIGQIQGSTVIVISHNFSKEKLFNRIFEMKDGCLVEK